MLVLAGFLALSAPLTPLRSAPQTFACQAEKIFQGSSTSAHQGWDLDGRGNWDGLGADNLLLGGASKWEGGGVPNNSSNFVALFSHVPLEPCDDTPLLNIVSRSEEPGERFGFSVAFVGDLDGDGKDDFVAGAPRGQRSPQTGFYLERGRAYLFLSSDDRFASAPPTSSVDASMIIEMPGNLFFDTTGELLTANECLPSGLPGPEVLCTTGDAPTDGVRFGYSVCRAGQFNPGQDDVPDFAVSAPGGTNRPGAALFPGRVYVFSGLSVRSIFQHPAYDPNVPVVLGQPVELGSEQFDLAYWTYQGLECADRFGHNIAYGGHVLDPAPPAGTPNDCILIGAPQFLNGGGGSSGDEHVPYGPGYVRIISINSDEYVFGENCGDEFGYSVDGFLDLTGDSRHEILVGAPRYDTPTMSGSLENAGKAYVFDMSVGSMPHPLETHEGDQAEGEFGATVASVGVVSLLDDVEDYAIGAPRYSTLETTDVCSNPQTGCLLLPGSIPLGDAHGGGMSAGRVYLYSRTAPSRPSTNVHIYDGENERDGAGWAICRVGNLINETIVSPPFFGSSTSFPFDREDLFFSAPRFGVTGVADEYGRAYLFRY